jgi:hypothetical protein
VVGEWDVSLDEIGSVLGNRNSGFYHDSASGICGACRSIESVSRIVSTAFQVLANECFHSEFVQADAMGMMYAKVLDVVFGLPVLH